MTDRLSPQEAVKLPCYDKPGMWVDSEDRHNREWAANQCRLHCTQLAWCEQQRQETVRDHRSAVGVWAGRVWTHTNYRTDGNPCRTDGKMDVA